MFIFDIDPITFPFTIFSHYELNLCVIVIVRGDSLLCRDYRSSGIDTNSIGFTEHTHSSKQHKYASIIKITSFISSLTILTFEYLEYKLYK